MGKLKNGNQTTNQICKLTFNQLMYRGNFTEDPVPTCEKMGLRCGFNFTSTMSCLGHPNLENKRQETELNLLVEKLWYIKGKAYMT